MFYCKYELDRHISLTLENILACMLKKQVSKIQKYWNKNVGSYAKIETVCCDQAALSQGK